MYLFTLVPFFYFLKTRLKTKVQRISWIFVYFIPLFIVFDHFASLLVAKNIFLSILGIILINYVYENGYIQNDVKTILKEQNPTLRLSCDEINNINNKWIVILCFRSIIFFILLYSYYVVSNSIYQTMVILFISIVLQVLYVFYNSIRNIINLFLILPLSYIRFFGFIIPFLGKDNIFEFILSTLFLYPFLKFLEFTKEKKYKLDKISKFVGNIDIFRVKYYVIISCVFLLISNEYIYLYISFYYLFFRIETYFLSTKNTFKKDLANTRKKDFINKGK